MARPFLMTAAVGCATGVALLTTTALAALSEQPRRPNFVVIFTDNQGYADVGCYGAEGFDTPNIDRIAKQGMRFTDFYATPACSPSRAALMTGCYPPRCGVPTVISPTERCRKMTRSASYHSSGRPFFSTREQNAKVGAEIILVRPCRIAARLFSISPRGQETQPNRNSFPSQWLWHARILVFSRRWPLPLAAANLIKSSDGRGFWDASSNPSFNRYMYSWPCERRLLIAAADE